MKIDIEQSTIQWHEWRGKGIGSSEIAAVMGKSPYKSAHRLWLEKTGRAQPEDLSQNPIVQKGVRLEPEARHHSNTYYDREFAPCLFQHDEYSFMKYSADGYDDVTGEILEIKCPQSKTHELAKAYQMPEHYRLQVQYGLLVSGASLARFVSYRPEDEIMLAGIEVLPDYELHKEMICAAKTFWECVEKDLPLPGTSSQPELEGDINAIENLKARIKELEAVKDALEKSIKDYMQTDTVIAGEYLLSWGERKGSIDYSRIKELDGVDLEQYRKPSSRVFSVKRNK